jgi:hypothetical protein
MAYQGRPENRPITFRSVFREPDKATRLGVVALLPDPVSPFEDEGSGWTLIPISYSYDSATDNHSIKVLRYEIDPSKCPTSEELFVEEDAEYAWHLAEQVDGDVPLSEFESLDEVAVRVIDQLVRFTNGSSTRPLDRMKNVLLAHIDVALRCGVSHEEISAVFHSIIGEQEREA